jgi:hypothetical protein
MNVKNNFKNVTYCSVKLYIHSENCANFPLFKVFLPPVQAVCVEKSREFMIIFKVNCIDFSHF